MNFEDKIISITSKSLLENNDFRNKLLDKKKRIVDAFRPNEMDFVDIYDEEKIKKDLEDIKKLEEKWTKESSEQEIYNKEIAELLEGVIADQAESNNWLGEDCEIMPASRVDDVKHGVDIISIFKINNEKQYLGLGLDITFASDKKVLLKKLNSIKDSIKEGTMSVLEYFQDSDTGEHKKLILPKVIVGSRLASAEKLISIWGGNSENRNKRLANDPMQSKIILESLFQLKYFYDYANELSNQDISSFRKEQYQDIARAYAQMYNTFYDLFILKNEMINEHYNEISDDIVFDTILEYTGNKNKT